MLYGVDKGSVAFMGAKMGLGVFTMHAGPNKLAIHQGANDGFRCVYIHCFEGPSVGTGLSVFSNAEFNSVLFNSEVAQRILTALKLKGIDSTKFKSDFDIHNR